MERQYRITLVDDHTLFRKGLKTLLDSNPGFRVIGEYSDGEEFIESLRAGNCDIPDVVLLDIDMPRMNGIVTTEKALEIYPEMKVITLSMYGDEEYYFQMVSLGVKGFILKNSEIKEVIEALRVVAEGGSYYFSRELLFNLVTNLKSALAENHGHIPEETLSTREKEILLHICKGDSNSEIADRLFISKRTVDNHRSNIMTKTGCRNTASLVVYAIKNNLVEI